MDKYFGRKLENCRMCESKKLYEFLGWEEVYDRCLTLSDGSICSARHCCSPVEQKPNTL